MRPSDDAIGAPRPTTAGGAAPSMAAMTRTRLLAQLTVAGGALWLAFAVQAALNGAGEGGAVVLATTAETLAFALFAASLALSAPAVAAIHLHQRGADGRLGRIGAVLAAGGAAAQAVVIGAIVVEGAETSWFGIGAPVAILTWVVGSVLLGVATRRARVLPGWVGVALPIATAFAIVGSDAGTSALLGVLQLVVGLRLVRATATAARPVLA